MEKRVIGDKYLKRFLRKYIDRNEAFNKQLRRQGAKVGKDVQIVDRFNFLYEPWFSNLIEIGDGVVIAAGVRFVSHDSSYANIFGDVPIKFGRIVVGESSYIGVNSIILPGVSIGESCLIGAGSVVNRNIPAHSIAVGNPARVIGSSEEGLIKMKKRLNESPKKSVFYIDMGGSYGQQKLKYGKDVISKVLQRYHIYCKKNDI